MSVLKPVYKVFRSIAMTLVVLIAVVYGGLYVLLSVPSFQKGIKTRAERELSAFLGSDLSIGNLSVNPFSELCLTDVSLLDPEGGKCASISKVAAGVDIWSLLTERKIVLNYAEIIGLDANIEQKIKDGPLNIKFLIDALSPKDKTKPPTPFDLRFRNIMIRRSQARFVRQWMTASSDSVSSFGDIMMSDLRLDLSIPVMKNDLFRFDIRRMTFNLTPGVKMTDLSAVVIYHKSEEPGKKDNLEVRGLKMSLPSSFLSLSDIDIELSPDTPVDVSLQGNVTPSDFSGLMPKLANFESGWQVNVDVSRSGSDIFLHNLELKNDATSTSLLVRGDVHKFESKDSLSAEIETVQARLTGGFLSGIYPLLTIDNPKVKDILNEVDDIEMNMTGKVSLPGQFIETEGYIDTSGGRLDIEGKLESFHTPRPHLVASLQGEELDLGTFLSSEDVGKASFNLDADVYGFDRKAEGSVNVTSDFCQIRGLTFSDMDISVSKEKEFISLSCATSGDSMGIDVDADLRMTGKSSVLDASADIRNLDLSRFITSGALADSRLSGKLFAHTVGDNADNITGNLRIYNVGLERNDAKKLALSDMIINIDSLRTGSDGRGYVSPRRFILRSDWMDAEIKGDIHPVVIGKEIRSMVASVFPSLLKDDFSLTSESSEEVNNFEFDLNIKGAESPYEFFRTPVRPLSDIPVKGHLNAQSGSLGLSFATPFLQQGSSKLVRNVEFDLTADCRTGMAFLSAGAVMPAKKGDAEVHLSLNALSDRVRADIGLNPTIESSIKGGISMEAAFARIPSAFNHNGDLSVHVDIIPSSIDVSGTHWTVGNGKIDYSGKRISVDDFLISHAGQFVKIDGVASERQEDVLEISLNDIDLDYIFNILNINYVSFGGMATGEVTGRRLLSKAPEAHTKFLRVKGLSYNGAVLGDGEVASEYDFPTQKVGIFAVIRDSLTRERRATVDGGIWVTRDSLSFEFDADRVNIGLMKPFISAFSSDLRGSGSGRCKLYGSFSDIDLTGNLVADTLSMKLDFTNTWYHAGRDSVFLHKGVIEIPPLTIYDDFGNTAEFSGWLRHRYFHEPVFNFRIRDARNFLCYDTNEKINPLWYGTIYGSGSAQVSGDPVSIDIDVNMSSEDGSKFWYVISDAEETDQYSFLTFTDRRKEKREAERVESSMPSYLARFMKKQEDMASSSANVILSIKGTVTPDALVTLIMDPKAGDNITARGNGALQMDYNMASNDLRMIGTYIIDEGNYNFTLQDIIIKNFAIREGSRIKFDGDPLNATLDIAATYRVNTNLTDLDKSFSTDKELNRTNVPVDAILQVDGPMTHPDISFDLELPTLTSDVERKVKSIVSTNDMMSRQIIYLLALNRFYTPEYTANSNSNTGAEWSSMASSTISSQLSNMLSQLTDKLDVAPSFRSDKGDFTDMEFDLALSSRLLNNRLLINGNFGYRDRHTSNTQFVGDFDIEYLLSKNGNLRLKAYNHFNDQNYYLRSALTTQGVGVVFRKDFDRLFRRHRHDEKTQEAVNDSVVDAGKRVAEDIK